MIRPATSEDVETYASYLSKHIAESGRDGDPVYAVPSDGAPFDPVSFATDVVARWDRPTERGGWQRTFVALDEATGAVAGHCELSAGHVPFERHRADLSLGVLRAHRRQGLGSALLETAIRWARDEPYVAWIDLGVFVPNPVAIAMYERAGFERTGLVRDRYRVGELCLDELTMTLAAGA